MFENYKVYEIEYGGKKMTFETGKMCCLSNASMPRALGRDGRALQRHRLQKAPRGHRLLPAVGRLRGEALLGRQDPRLLPQARGRVPPTRRSSTSRLVDRPIRPLFPKDMRNDVLGRHDRACRSIADCSPEIAGMLRRFDRALHLRYPLERPDRRRQRRPCRRRDRRQPDRRAARDEPTCTVTVACTDEDVIVHDRGGRQRGRRTTSCSTRIIQRPRARSRRWSPSSRRSRPRSASRSSPSSRIEVPARAVRGDQGVRHRGRAAPRSTPTTRTSATSAWPPSRSAIHAQVRRRGEVRTPPRSTRRSTSCRSSSSAAGCSTSRSASTAASMDEIRPLAAEVGLLPRVHGSGMFTRGQTQVLTIGTLGTDQRGPDARRHRRRGPEALHAPVQLPLLLGGRDQAQPRPRPPRDRPRRARRARPRAGDSVAWRSSPTPSASSPRCSPPTAPPRRAPSAAPRWP